MARSKYIYGLENQYGELFGVFTVKREAISSIDKTDGYREIWRRPDGKLTWHETPDVVYTHGVKGV